VALIDDIHATVHRIESYALWLRDAVDDLGRYTGGIHPYTQWKQTNDRIYDPILGLDNLHNLVANLNIDRIADKAAILAAIAALPAGSAIVIPPAADNANAVWDYYPPMGNGKTAATLMADAGGLGDNLLNAAGMPLRGASLFAINGNWANNYVNSVGTLPSPDWSDIRPDDTRLSWLQRTDSGHTWTAFAPAYEPFAHYSGDLTHGYWNITPLFSEADFEVWKLALSSRRVPIWPGLANVTLGTTVPAVVSTTLELPMDGIIWLTTSYPPARARWGAAPYYSIYHTGRLAFITDNGDLEPFQYMGWQNAIFVPQTMGRAAGVVVFLEAGIEGAITPWDITV
jgi:hypothetical protein